MAPPATTTDYRDITEDDLLYCILFSGDGQPHSNRPYCAEVGYGTNFFYGDATVGMLLSQFHRHSGIPESACSVQDLEVAFTARLHFGERMRADYTLSDPVDGVRTLHVEGIKPDGTVAARLVAQLTVEVPA